MDNEAEQAAAPAPSGQAAKPLEFAKIDALRRHMLLTVQSMVIILGTTRVSYYNWLKGTKMRKKTAEHMRRVARLLVVCIQNGWPNDAVYVATQPQRLQMLQERLKELDNQLA